MLYLSEIKLAHNKGSVCFFVSFFRCLLSKKLRELTTGFMAVVDKRFLINVIGIKCISKLFKFSTAVTWNILAALRLNLVLVVRRFLYCFHGV